MYRYLKLNKIKISQNNNISVTSQRYSIFCDLGAGDAVVPLLFNKKQQRNFEHYSMCKKKCFCYSPTASAYCFLSVQHLFSFLSRGNSLLDLCKQAESANCSSHFPSLASPYGSSKLPFSPRNQSFETVTCPRQHLDACHTAKSTIALHLESLSQLLIHPSQ